MSENRSGSRRGRRKSLLSSALIYRRRILSRDIQLTHEESLVRVAMDHSTHRGVVDFLERVESRSWVRNVDDGLERDELASNRVVQGIGPVNDAQNMR